MKYKITKASFEKLSDDLKLEYKADGDHYKLQIEGQPSEEGSEALRNALDREKEDNRQLRADLKEASTKLKTAEDKAAEGDPDAKREIATLTKRLERLQTEYDGKIAAKDTAIANSHRAATVKELAGKISTSPGVIAPHIEGRLEVTIDPDTNLPKVGIKGKDGKVDPSLTLDKLGEEFVANPEFKGIIRASGASGTRPPAGPSGAPQLQGNGNPNQPIDLVKATGPDFVNAIREKVAARQAGS